jgi:hypothetical protein
LKMRPNTAEPGKVRVCRVAGEYEIELTVINDGPGFDAKEFAVYRKSLQRLWNCPRPAKV